MIDYYEYSIPELVKLLGARFKDYRLRSNITQKEDTWGRYNHEFRIK